MQIFKKTKQLGQEQEVGVNDLASTLTIVSATLSLRHHIVVFQCIIVMVI